MDWHPRQNEGDQHHIILLYKVSECIFSELLHRLGSKSGHGSCCESTMSCFLVILGKNFWKRWKTLERIEKEENSTGLKARDSSFIYPGARVPI